MHTVSRRRLDIDAVHRPQVFNSRMCQLVLGAGAMATAGLRSITAKHLALSAQAAGALGRRPHVLPQASRGSSVTDSPACVEESGGAVLSASCPVDNRRGDRIAPAAAGCAGGACAPHAPGAAVARVRPPAPGACLPVRSAARIWVQSLCSASARCDAPEDALGSVCHAPEGHPCSKKLLLFVSLQAS